MPRLTREEMERRRLEAAKDLLAGTKQADVARRYRAGMGTVSRWKAVLREEGVDGLRRRTAPGAPSRLTDAQWERLGRMLREGAAAHGFGTDLWTGPRVERLIKETFGVADNPNYVVDALRTRLRLSWQTPRRVARERDEAKRRAWLETTWEALKGSPRDAGRSRSSASPGSRRRPSSGRRGRPSGSAPS